MAFENFIGVDHSTSVLENPSHFLNLNALKTVIDNLKEKAPTLREQYLNAQPYPHLILQDLFPADILDQIVEDFPKADERNWITWQTQHEWQSISRGIQNLSPLTQLFSLWLNSSDFIQVLESILGVENLVGDPLFHRAGLHEMYRDGVLELHGDYTKHYCLPLVRRFNLITYLNRDWDPAWGGELVMQDYQDSRKTASCPCTFNTTVIFPTNDKTLHGVPNPLTCPPDRSRKLLSIYYWNPIPMPFIARVGTPLIWASEQKNIVKKTLKKFFKRL